MELSVQGDEHYMKKALQKAEEAYEQGEIPVGAVIVCADQIIAQAHNQTEALNDVTAHGEMLALTSAFSAMNSKYLPECTLYVTLEPCVMCAGALYWAQIDRLVYGAEDPNRGFSRIGRSLLHPKTEVAFGVCKEQCSDLVKSFFRDLRND